MQPTTLSTTLSITPEDALIDVPCRIALQGLAPGEEVTLESRTLRGPGVVWRASATFRADDCGVVDLQRDAPLAGSYSGVSAMGLVWSQAPEHAGAPREVFAADPASALTTEVTLQRHGASALQARLVQRLQGAGVTRREVREEGLVGTLFTPAGPGPHPAVLVLNGSGGGINEPRAALYASHGYAALALGYFKAPGLSDYISNTPLEIFETALHWLHRELQPRHGFVALSGQSARCSPSWSRPLLPTCPAPWCTARKTPAILPTARTAATARPGRCAVGRCHTSGKTTAPPPGHPGTKAPSRAATRWRC